MLLVMLFLLHYRILQLNRWYLITFYSSQFASINETYMWKDEKVKALAAKYDSLIRLYLMSIAIGLSNKLIVKLVNLPKVLIYIE